jgi:hypothetical protein
MLGLGYAGALACRYELSGNPDTAAAAIAAYRQGTSDTRVDGFRRLEAARAGARFAASCNETGPSLELYGTPHPGTVQSGVVMPSGQGARCPASAGVFWLAEYQLRAWAYARSSGTPGAASPWPA